MCCCWPSLLSPAPTGSSAGSDGGSEGDGAWGEKEKLRENGGIRGMEERIRLRERETAEGGEKKRI